MGELKSEEEEIKPSTYVHEENYDFSRPEIKRTLPEMNPEQITSQAEDIIREVVKEEMQQMQNDISDQDFIDYSQAEQPEANYSDVASEVDESSIYDSHEIKEEPRENASTFLWLLFILSHGLQPYAYILTLRWKQLYLILLYDHPHG